MTVIDTSAWSLALRRDQARLSTAEARIAREVVALIHLERAILLGVVRQELLSGIRHAAQFERLRTELGKLRDTPVSAADHEQAAIFYNTCRARGIAGSATDLLICAVAWRLDVPIFTTDPDFARYADHLPITLHRIAGGST